MVVSFVLVGAAVVSAGSDEKAADGSEGDDGLFHGCSYCLF
jgi:hypothetical protein